MGIFKALGDSISGVFSDQWRDIVTVKSFDETVVVKPGVRVDSNNGRGSNTKYSEGVITNGSKIYVPENTLAIIFDGSGIEGIITEPGSFEYHNGEKSILSKDNAVKSIMDAMNVRFDFGGQPSDFKKIIFLNLREIRNIRFGTRGPLLYHDSFYDTDLEIIAHGVFSLQITNPAIFIQNYLPPNAMFYDFGNLEATEQLKSELCQSIIVALGRVSKEYRISDLPAHINEVVEAIKNDKVSVGTWTERYGFELVSFVFNNVELTEDSRDLVNSFSANRMTVNAYDGISQRASDVAFKQSVAAGIKEHGLGDGAGFVMGMNMLQEVGQSSPVGKASIDEQIEQVKKIKELVDMGALTPEEFEIKKKEIMGL